MFNTWTCIDLESYAHLRGIKKRHLKETFWQQLKVQKKKAFVLQNQEPTFVPEWFFNQSYLFFYYYFAVKLSWEK